MPSRLRYLSPALALFWAAGTLHAAEPVSFRNEVMAVLSRGGCNQGPCHGNLNGKGGFKLSLRGQDPGQDYRTLTHDVLGRRVDPLAPAASLLLAKATGRLPHEGNIRFTPDSPEYDLLYRWIAAGMPRDPASTPRVTRLEVSPAEKVLFEPAREAALRVRAVFSDGRARDVTRLAVYEPSSLKVRVSPEGVVERLAPGEASILVRYLDQQATVRLAFVPARPGYAWPDLPEENVLDRHVFARLRTLRMLPSELAPDGVFLRRVYLDTLGILPSVEETRAFLTDTRPDRRERLIDALLRRPELADFWALKWSDLLRNEEKTLDAKGVRLFHGWLRDSMLAGTPLNEMARRLLAARGSTYSHPPANYYRALRDPYARAEATAQVFLGARLQCARCHNHPFDSWTQDDYHSFAAFFARVQYRIVENSRRDRLDRHEFVGEQVVWLDRTSELPHPRTQEPLAPRLLGEPAPPAAGGDRLQALADWVADPANPFFARTQANRVWQHLVGRGIVDPLDDFRASNPPSCPPLLDALAGELRDSGFDLRRLLRTILTSRTYQLSALPNATNADDETGLSRALVRPLQAEQLYDALCQVTGARARLPGLTEGVRAGQMPGSLSVRRRGEQPSQDEMMLRVFGKPPRSLSCECERSEDSTLGQAFQLITGPVLNRMLTEPDNRLGRLLASGRPPEAMVEELFLAALCRPPTPVEMRRAVTLLTRASSRRAALEDLTWGLVNAKEFLLRR